MLRKKIIGIVSIALFLSACQGLPKHRLHQRVVADTAIVESGGVTLLLPPNVEVREMSVSGLTEVVPSWTRDANANVMAQLTQAGFAGLDNQTIIALPELTDEETAVVEEHLDLAKVVWANAHILTTMGGPAWRHKIARFDYSIGPGLAFLADKTGADKALIILGEDMHTTTGRKTMSIALAAFGVYVPLGHTIMVANLVDLQTGDLLWVNTLVDATGNQTYLNPEDVANATHALFLPYPGVATYRELIKQSGR